MQYKKNVSIRALPELGGGGLPLPEFFCALFLLKEKVSPMVATAERVGKVARIRGWGGGLANSGNARIETFYFVLHSSITLQTQALSFPLCMWHSNSVYTQLVKFDQS